MFKVPAEMDLHKKLIIGIITTSESFQKPCLTWQNMTEIQDEFTITLVKDASKKCENTNDGWTYRVSKYECTMASNTHTQVRSTPTRVRVLKYLSYAAQTKRRTK